MVSSQYVANSINTPLTVALLVVRILLSFKLFCQKYYYKNTTCIIRLSGFLWNENSGPGLLSQA
jgi:hypothetical protein